ncbi:uncharacterized protein LOC128556296 [Mercenaria mercenaria]|uniref:uncharacterized protein LOC128556296 n=1 Tax=Mercenaria mercenaria TaxID=6596 RepID=UPI00234EBE3A|nr:uncharacterized protein LOC128556296 [Mercenaria mercenaria]XP_053396872.1 uncharacterized protein LOC128556296 [Mercenaria mercenaria]
MASYLKVQLALKSINLEGDKLAKVTRRLKKACRTRWLSMDAAVSGVRQDYEALLQTLSLLEEKDAAAHGLLMKMKSLKFLGAIYILSDILPVLSELSRHFQHDSLNFSAILPAINQCKDKLKQIRENEEPLQKLSEDIDSFTDMCAEIKSNAKSSNELHALLRNYIDSLIKNIDRRFSDTSAVVAAFAIFDPTTLPRSDEVHFKTYGDSQIALLADHFFSDDVEKEKLKIQWNGFKYHTHDILLPNMPKEVRDGKARMTPTEWLLLQLLRSAGLRHFNPELVFVAEAAASLPVSNAWPERGASILKVIKTKLRNRLSIGMLEGLLHVGINGPDVDHSQPVIKKAVNTWLASKPRRKLETPKGVTQCESRNASVQTEESSSFTPCREDIRAVLKEILLEEEFDSHSDEDADNDSDFDPF